MRVAFPFTRRNPMTPDFQLGLQAGFRDLRDRGYFAQQNWQCCNTCGIAAVPEWYAERFVFYHEQEAVRLCEKDEVSLNWAGNGEQIVEAFQRLGLKVEWNGKPERKICVSAPPGYKYTHPEDIASLNEAA
jgi:Domain of unknown function (DUF6891)